MVQEGRTESRRGKTDSTVWIARVELICYTVASSPSQGRGSRWGLRLGSPAPSALAADTNDHRSSNVAILSFIFQFGSLNVGLG